MSREYRVEFVVEFVDEKGSCIDWWVIEADSWNEALSELASRTVYPLIARIEIYEVAA